MGTGGKRSGAGIAKRVLPPLIFFAVLGWAALVLNCKAVLVWQYAKPSAIVAGATAELTCWYFTGTGFAGGTDGYAVNVPQENIGCRVLVDLGNVL